MVESTKLSGLRRIAESDAPLVVDFLRAIPEADRLFFKEEVDAQTVRSWATESRGRRWLLHAPDGEPCAYLAIIPGVGWAAHVGELRLLVAASHRRRGLGR